MAGDPFFNSVSLLCHLDGTNGGTTFTDNSNSAHALTPTLAITSTTQVKFGTASLSVTGSVNSGLYVGAPNTFTDFSFPGQFTVECWSYRTAAPSGTEVMLGVWTGSNNVNLSWQLYLYNAPGLAFAYSIDGTTPIFTVAAGFSPPLNQWVHYAADRDASGVIRVYANGAVIASTTDARSLNLPSAPCVVGHNVYAGTDQHWSGFIDEVRVTNGVARYAGAFTPPTGPFPNSLPNTAWNPSDKTANVTLSNLNLTATQGVSTGGVRAVDRQITGKFYWEYTANTITVNATAMGVATVAHPVGASPTSTGTPYAIGLSLVSASTVWRNGAILASGLGAISSGTVIGTAVDLINNLIWFKVLPSGNWNGSATASPATGVGGLPLWGPGFPIYPFVSMGNANEQITANFGDSTFSGTVPSGFTAGFTAGTVPPLNDVVTQLGTETWGQAVPPAMQLTQVGTEAWAQLVQPQMQLTQVGTEVWATVAGTIPVPQQPAQSRAQQIYPVLREFFDPGPEIRSQWTMPRRAFNPPIIPPPSFGGRISIWITT